jgi:hypothetical protein
MSAFSRHCDCSLKVEVIVNNPQGLSPLAASAWRGARMAGI